MKKVPRGTDNGHRTRLADVRLIDAINAIDAEI